MAIVNVTLLLLLLAHLVQGQLQCSRIITVNNATGNDTQGCLNGDYPCSSLDYALYNLQSYDCVNVTSNNVSLSTVVELNDTHAFTIEGHGNTIVMCSNNSRITCKYCSNVVIEGITWHGCGDPTNIVNGAINFEKIANLSIKNCTFQHSKSRALTIWTISGLIELIYTSVIFNANYDTIYCHPDQYGTFRCNTEHFNVTGGVRIQESAAETNVSIINCVFGHNGHFGNIVNSDIKSQVPYGREIADGAGLLFNNINNFTVNLLIENSIFSSNRGRTGAGAFIRTINSLSIKIVNTTFMNNSVLDFHINSSAFMVFTDHPKDLPFVALLQLLMCNFYNNTEGRNMINYIVAGSHSELLIENCTFVNNTNNDITMLELNVQSTGSSVDIKHSQFTNNSGSAVIYFQIRSKHIATSLFNIKMMNNVGFATEKGGGFILSEVSEDNHILNITELTFMNHNYTSNGGGVYVSGSFQSSYQCYIQDSHFEGNFGFGSGTVVYSSLSCATEKTYVMFINNCRFVNNEGESIIYVAMENYVLPVFLVLSDTDFSNNNGTPLHLFNAALVGNQNTTFKSNQADIGAAFHLTDSYILLNYSSFQLNLVSNFANSYGGAVFIDFRLSNIYRSQCHWLLHPNDNFCTEIMHNYNGCIVVMYTSLFCELFPREVGVTSNISMINNTALLSGSAIFYDNANRFPPSKRSQNTSDPLSLFSIPDSFTIFPNASEPLTLSTQPQQLQLLEPAMCNDDFTICNISEITLGEEILIPTKILGYNSKTAEATRFFVECIQNCNDFMIDGNSITLINNLFSGLRIIGVNIQQKASIALRLHSGVIDLMLNIELLPCQLGYAYNSVTKRCHCYTVNNIVSCGTTTTIRKDYWFGMIGEQATVSICPNKYCNFSRTEANSGSFLLQSFHDDQCGCHRAGQACGSCDSGYTLSFDFDDCVNDNECSPGITILIIICVILYWIIIMMIILIIMYFKINIGYLYGIIYYYSVVDILLGQILNYSDGLDILDKMITSIIRLSPGFVGFLCFIKGMSGIDQYVLRFVHPTGIIVILTLLGVLARYSRQVTRYISRGIIPAICVILTLTYTSIADTSLQLLRSLRFAGVDKDYTYLSPEFEYLTGRHIFYFIIALLYILVIVIGLPLLLFLEPFINHWVNFSNMRIMCMRISLKPILDQFQGCYKDNCRWFAAIYLICRQAIIIVLILNNFFDTYVELYLLVIICLVTVLSHSIIQPYNKKYNALNKFDAFILLLLVLVVSLQMISLSNGFTTDAIVGIAFALILFPIIAYVMTVSCIKMCSKDSESDNMETFENSFNLIAIASE